MDYRISIREKNQKVILKLEQREHQVWNKKIKTSQEEIIQKLLSELLPLITQFKKKGKNIKITLPEQGELILYNYPNLKHQEVLKEMREQLKQIDQKNKRKTITRGLFVTMALTVGAASQIAFHSLKKKGDIKEPTRIETEMDLTLLPLTEMSNVVTVQEVALTHEMDLTLENVPYQQYIPTLGTKQNDEKITFVKENYGEYTEKYAQISGIDQEIIECLLAQERMVHSSEIDRGGAIGIAQIQYDAHIGETLKLRNELTGEIEQFQVTDDMLKSVDGNIKVGVTILQNNLDRYQGNILIALQSYNYGVGATRKILSQTAERLNVSIDDILQDATNLEWLKEVKNYKGGNYGDPNYLDHVLARYGKEQMTAIYSDFEPVEFIINQEKEKNPTY